MKEADGAVRKKRILVACRKLVLAGGLLRFERVGQVLRKLQHELAYVALDDEPQAKWEPEFPVLTFEQAASQQWSAVFVPGAGFPPEIDERLSLFQSDQFGTRVQHILNDQSRRSRFLAVNRAFRPHAIVFNNGHWPPGSYTEFLGNRFFTLVGAVDTAAFRPDTSRRRPLSSEAWVVGGLASKSPDPLLAALGRLPDDTKVRLFGYDHMRLAERYPELVDSGRLTLAGPLFGEDLCDFYRSVDCIVMTEEHAGWANIVAEAMASGVPAICTSHGTLSIARHEETALVIDTPSPEAIADAILRLRGDTDLCASLSAKARQTIEPLNWEMYTEKLLDICDDREKKDYYQAPEYGLYGKWPIGHRLRDLDAVLDDCANRTVLDLGAAEGIVARQFLTRSAKLVHGFEMDPRRVATASQICAQWEDTEFRDADVSHWDRFVKENDDLLLQSYDIVLYLGLHQHLARLRRAKVIRSAVRLAARYFVVRMPVAVFELDGLAEVLQSEGLEEIALSDAPNAAASMGPVRIYRRAGMTTA